MAGGNDKVVLIIKYQMRIAVIQMMYPIGHRRLDEEFVRILSKEHQLIIVDDGKYFSKEICDNSNIERLVVAQPYINRWEPLKVFMRRLCLLLVLFKLRKIKYDVLLFLNCHNSLYKIERWLPSKKRVLIHHFDVDGLLCNNKFLHHFSSVKNNFEHVFLADYISNNFIAQTGVDKNHVYTVHQPLVFENAEDNEKKENLLVGLGNSTDELFVSEAIELDQKKQSEEFKCRLILRSKRTDYKGHNLEVITGFLPRTQYESLYSRAKVSVVNYKQSYIFRYSGIIDDSLSKGLFVISNDTLCGRYFASVYPNSVRIINGINDVWEMMKGPLPQSPESERKLFRERHSSQYVLAQFNSVLE